MQPSLLEGDDGDGHLILGGYLRHSFTVAVKEAELERTLHFVYGYRSLAEQAGEVGGKIRALAWEQVKEFPPIRVRSAQNLLEVSDHTIDVWCRRGILELRAERPKRVSLDSVLTAREALEEIRAAGQDRDVTAALLNKLELDELREDARFRSSLAQAKRGERGEWPKGLHRGTLTVESNGRTREPEHATPP